MLALRPFRIDDEAAALAAHRALAEEGFDFLLGFAQDGGAWSAHVARTEANSRGEQIPGGWVPATFLAAVVDGELVGRVSIRHQLNDWLSAYGGHIGYAVLREHRRKGYATEMLRQGLIVARSLGIEDVLIMCDDTNVASARTIEACGGELEDIVPGEVAGTRERRYWIR